MANVGDTVRVEGLCVSTCGHGSTHITLMGSDTTQVIEALADERMQSFDPLISNRTVAVEGVVAEQRVCKLFFGFDAVRERHAGFADV